MTSFRLGLFVVFSLCGFSFSVFPQTALLSFTSSNGVFRFEYPALLVNCTEQGHEEGYSGSWMPADSCESYIPICDDNGIQSSRTIACFAYPKARFKDYPTFGGAAFAVAEVKGAASEERCLSGSPDWVIDSPRSARIAIINGVKFRVFETDGAAMSHSLEGHVYRTFHRNTCYELAVKLSRTSSAVFDPPAKEVPRRDSREVRRRLDEAVRSFRFLK